MPTNSDTISGGNVPVRSNLTGARAASTVTLLAGIWFFISPWVYGSWRHGVAFNNWFASALIIWFAITRIVKPAYATAMCWCNMALGIWVFCSPWIYGYAAFDAARFINSLVVGFIVFVFSVISLRISAPKLPPRQTPLPRT